MIYAVTVRQHNLLVGTQTVLWPPQTTRMSASGHLLEKQAKVCFDWERSKANIKSKADQGGRKGSNGYHIPCRLYG